MLLASSLFVALALARFNYMASTPDMPIRHATEQVLKQDLQSRREAIDHYTLAKRHPRDSLQDFIEEPNLRAIPVDPIPQRADWFLAPHRSLHVTSSTLDGFDDIHSASAKNSRAGTRYDRW